MRRSGWTPSIVPNGNDQNVYLVVDCDGNGRRCVWREADGEETALETVITVRLWRRLQRLRFRLGWTLLLVLNKYWMPSHIVSSVSSIKPDNEIFVRPKKPRQPKDDAAKTAGETPDTTGSPNGLWTGRSPKFFNRLWRTSASASMPPCGAGSPSP
jgi:hypothetical protein